MKRTVAVLVLAVLMAASPGAWAAPAAAGGRATRFVAANGIRLHYVDWGGRGEALLLLPGLGHDGYVFDSFALHFTDRFRVLALTRRGFGASDKPESGYDVGTRVEDIRAFLDALHIRRVHLVGHSIAGDELTLFAARYPARVLKLVYLDAAFDRSGVTALMESDPAVTPAQRLAADQRQPPEIRRAMAACRKASEGFRPDYRIIKAPALAIYATSPAHPLAAGETDAKKRARMNAWWAANVVPRTRSSIEQFRREARRGKVVEMPGANHFLFLGPTEKRVVATTRAFLLE